MVVRLVAVFCGGIVGTLLRVLVDVAVPHASPGELSVSTVIVNTIGSFVLGVLTADLWLRPTTPDWVRIGVGPGLLGSFTTFSAIALNVVAAVDESRFIDGFLAVGLSVTFGLAAAWAGLRFGTRMSQKRRHS